jgi:hypothetical protein
MFQIYIHGLSNEKHTLDICECEIEFKNLTILQLKEKLITSKNLPMSAEHITLIHAGKQLENNQTIGYYQIENRSTLMSVHRMPGGRCSDMRKKKHSLRGSG